MKFVPFQELLSLFLPSNIYSFYHWFIVIQLKHSKWRIWAGLIGYVSCDKEVTSLNNASNKYWEEFLCGRDQLVLFKILKKNLKSEQPRYLLGKETVVPSMCTYYMLHGHQDTFNIEHLGRLIDRNLRLPKEPQYFLSHSSIKLS